MPQKRDVTLTVFMEGTANPMDPITTQIALFSRICKATPLRTQEVRPPRFQSARLAEDCAYKLSFPGCGVSHGLRGTLFGHGLKEQVGIVRGYLEAWVHNGSTVTVNFVGLSRGGIGGLYLAQELTGFRAEQVIVNLLLFDPVPGDLIWMSRFMDWAGVMNSNLAMDVSAAPNLGRVLVLYPYEPLPAIAFHAPLLAKFPPGCQLEEDVILGCHQGALWLRPAADTCLAFARVRDFLLECGSRIDTQQSHARDLDVHPKLLADMLAGELRREEPSVRSAHAPVAGSLVVRHATGQFLNRFHRVLLQRLNAAAQPDPASRRPLYMLELTVPAAA